MPVFLVCPGQNQKVQGLLDWMVNILKPLFPNRVLEVLEITRKFLEALGQILMFLLHLDQTEKVPKTLRLF
jgi:hypothetical protein